MSSFAPVMFPGSPLSSWHPTEGRYHLILQVTLAQGASRRYGGWDMRPCSHTGLALRWAADGHIKLRGRSGASRTKEICEAAGACG